MNDEDIIQRLQQLSPKEIASLIMAVILRADSVRKVEIGTALGEELRAKTPNILTRLLVAGGIKQGMSVGVVATRSR